MNHQKLSVALIQMNSGTKLEKNIERAVLMSKEAISKKAAFILLPEVFSFRGAGAPHELIPGSSTLPLFELAKEKKVWILAGSIREVSHAEGKPFNTSVLINPSGKCEVIYRKMHLFQLQDEFREADNMTPGAAPALGEIEGIKIGLSICYDLRFPELYRHYGHLGAQILTAPSSFTTVTGKDHWEILLRARAIENQCFVLAPNQTGVGAGKLPTYGHSMVVDPWGRILAQGSEDKEEVVYAELDFGELERIRAKLPALQHRVLK